MHNAWRSLIVAAVITLAGALTAPSASAQFNEDITEFYPISGLSHMHSTFSDGVATIDQLACLAKKMGLDYLIMSDHADDVEATSHDKVARAFSSRNAIESFLNFAGSRTKEHGIENYIEACRQASTKYDILVIPGLEVELGGDRDNVYDPSGDPNRIHMLVIGPMTAELFHELMECVSTHNRMDIVQDQIGAIAHRGNCAVVIAHPFASDPLRPGWYTFYKNCIDNIDAVECFNISDDKSLEALGLTNRDPLQGVFKPVSAIGGVDFHGISPTELSNFERVSILMPGQPLSNNFNADCTLIANAICDNPIIALNKALNSEEIDEIVLNRGRIYQDDTLISTSGNSGRSDEFKLNPQSTYTYFYSDLVMSGFTSKQNQALNNENSRQRLVKVIAQNCLGQEALDRAISDAQNRLAGILFPDTGNRFESGAQRSDGNPFGPSLRINTR